MLFFKKLKQMKDHAERINDYFCNAVTVFLFKGEEEARVAALAAAKLAAKKQRDSMIAYLAGMASDIVDSSPNKPLAVAAAKDLLELKKDIEAKDWNIKDVIAEEQKLKKLNPEYLHALDKANPDVFVKKYPELFLNK